MFRGQNQRSISYILQYLGIFFDEDGCSTICVPLVIMYCSQSLVEKWRRLAVPWHQHSTQSHITHLTSHITQHNGLQSPETILSPDYPTLSLQSPDYPSLSLQSPDYPTLSLQSPDYPTLSLQSPHLSYTISAESTLSYTISAESRLSVTISTESRLSYTISAESRLSYTISTESTLSYTISAESTLSYTISAESRLSVGFKKKYVFGIFYHVFFYMFGESNQIH